MKLFSFFRKEGRAAEKPAAALAVPPRPVPAGDPLRGRIPEPLTALDPNGQPWVRGYNASRRLDRDIHELLGLLRGVTAGGALTEDGAREVANWINRNEEVIPLWPVNIIVANFGHVITDGRIDRQGCRALFELFMEVTGPNAAHYLNSTTATTLPLTKPVPTVSFVDQVFVFTGRFLYGTRPACERAVCERGGTCERYITKRTVWSSGQSGVKTGSTQLTAGRYSRLLRRGKSGAHQQSSQKRTGYELLIRSLHAMPSPCIASVLSTYVGTNGLNTFMTENSRRIANPALYHLSSRCVRSGKRLSAGRSISAGTSPEATSPARRILRRHFES